MNECRICLEEDEICNLISPCLCRGTTKYIHEKCLNEWRILSENRDNEHICPQCKFEYHFEENIPPGGLKCFSIFINLCAKNIASLIIFNFFIFFVLYYLLFFINNANYYLHGSQKDEVPDALEFKTFNVLQLASILITTFYVFIIILDFYMTKNRNLLFEYYRRKLLFPQMFLYLFGFLITFFSPIFGLIINTILINSILKCYIEYHDEVNSITSKKVISISDQELVQLNI